MMMMMMMMMMNYFDFYSKEKGILQPVFSDYLNLDGQDYIPMLIISVWIKWSIRFNLIVFISGAAKSTETAVARCAIQKQTMILELGNSKMFSWWRTRKIYLYDNINAILTLREKCPNTELFLVRVFLYSDWIQENTDQK